MTGLDTSVVLRLLVGEPIEQAHRANQLLDDLFVAGEKACVSDLVISEVYFALQHHYSVPKAEAFESLKQMFASGEIVGTGVAPSVLQTKNLASAKPGFVDRMILAGYRSEQNTLATFEKKSRSLEGVLVL